MMNTWKSNLHFGTLNLRKRGKKGTWHVNIAFKGIGKDNLFRASTGTNELALAQPKALKMVADEHKRRLSGTVLNRNMQPKQYLEDVHIPWLHTQLDLPLDNKPNNIMTARKIKNDSHVIRKWFIPYLEGYRWEHLETSAFGRDITTHLRKHVMDATITSYFGMLNRMFRQAEIDSFITTDHMKGVPALSQSWMNNSKDNKHSYAIASDEMIRDLLQTAKWRMDSAKRKDLKRTYTQTYAFIRILVDTGMRPYTASPLNWNDFQDQGDMVIIDRKEKNKRYNAQGGSMTREALDDLRQLYLSEGTNVNTRSNLPLIHHAPCGNKYGTREVKPYSQIGRLNKSILNIMQILGWYDMQDKEGRKYRLYSIRKWHINKSIQAGEDRFQIADRVGHTYAVLEKFYLNKEMKQNKKADLWQTTKTGGNEKVV